MSDLKLLLEDLINEFDLDKFNLFFRRKMEASGGYRQLNEDYSRCSDDDFTDGNILGEIKLQDNESLIICAFKVKKSLTERSGKKAQYEKAKNILKEKQKYFGGIFIFYDEEGNFRFSLIYPEYIGIRKQWNSFRRFTYFVSSDPQVTNKTFLKQMIEGDFSTPDKIKEAFSVEKVTKEFYQEIANWYFWALENCKFPKDAENAPDGSNNAIIRLITRMIFIWFMRERGLVPKKLFKKAEIEALLISIDDKKSTYYKAILQNLFFATLSVEMDQRKFISNVRGHKGYNPNFGNQYVYRYHDLFNDPSQIENCFNEVPFLNGGLFECRDDKDKGIIIDGFSETKKNQPQVPNFLFFNGEDKIDLNYIYGTKNKTYKVRGLLEILSSFNFTIDENSHDDADIALDPELLGRVFENLLASFNPETSTTARKATGSYYTPREIVDYMVSESLKAYFKTHLEENNKHKIDEIDEKLEALFSSSLNSFTLDETRRLVQLIKNLKIVDPAAGSGAFIMGALHKLVFILSVLDPDNQLWKQAQIDTAQSLTDPSIKKETLSKIEEHFKGKNADYGRKLFLIQRCIYGVDIQETAVEIAKLRFFISLLVDETIDENKNNRGIEALPNLDFKIMQGNSLLEEFHGVKLFDENLSANYSGGLGLVFDSDKIFNELAVLRKKYFEETNKDKKKSHRKEIDKKTWELIEASLRQQYDKYNSSKQNIETGKILAKVNELKNLSEKPFFLWKLYFSEVFIEKGGFDIVIGNPPYIQLQKDKGKLAEIYKNCGFKTFERTGDIYMLFYEKSIDLLKNKGVLCFITSNKWMRAGYGKKLRGYFSKYNPISLIDLGPGIFESATVDTNIILIQKSDSNNSLEAVSIDNSFDRHNNLYKYIKENQITLTDLSDKVWFVCSTEEKQLKEKIEKIGVPLKNWNVNVYRGVLTGLNEAFIIDTPTKERLCREDPKSKEILKPILRGRDIKRYTYNWAGLWLIHTGYDIDVQKKYPAVYKHLMQFKNKAVIRYDQGKNWWNLRACSYYDQFEKEKIVWAGVGGERFEMALAPKGVFLREPANLMTGNLLTFFIGIIQSNLIGFHYNKIKTEVGNGSRFYVRDFIEIPIPPITPQNIHITKKIENYVDEVIKKKQQGKETCDTEKAIDLLVYELYDLTPDEIEIIESS